MYRPKEPGEQNLNFPAIDEAGMQISEGQAEITISPEPTEAVPGDLMKGEILPLAFIGRQAWFSKIA